MKRMLLKQHVADLMPGMAKKAVCLSGVDVLSRAIQAMTASGTSAVLIFEDGDVEGIVTRGDILRCLGSALPSGDVLGQRLELVMSAPVVTAVPSDTIAEALHKMVSAGVKHLPLMEEGQGGPTAFLFHLTGLLGYKADLLQAEAEQLHNYIDHLHEADKD